MLILTDGSSYCPISVNLGAASLTVEVKDKTARKDRACPTAAMARVRAGQTVLSYIPALELLYMYLMSYYANYM